MRHQKPSLWFPFTLTAILVFLSIFVLAQSPGKAVYYDYNQSGTRTSPDRREATCRPLLDPGDGLYCLPARQRHLAWLMLLGPAAVGSVAYTGWAYRRFLQAAWREDEQLAESPDDQESSAT